VRAGQEGGFLEDVLKRIADFTEHQEDLKAKVVGALAYPAFLAVVGSAILTALVIFVVPQFESVFTKLEEKGELPALTGFLLEVSHGLQRHWWWLLGLVVTAVVLYRRWSATERGRLLVDGWRLRLPGVGNIFLSYALSRFTRLLGTM